MSENYEKDNNITEEEIYRILKEDAANIEPPESLSPASIEQKLIGVTQETGRRKSPWVIAAGMAACLVFGVLTGLLVFSLIGKGGDEQGERQTTLPVKMEESASDAKSDTAESADDSSAPQGELNYDEICDIINKYNSETRARYEENMYKGDIVEEAQTEDYAEAAPAAEDSGRASESIGSSAAQTSQNKSDDYSETDKQVEGVSEGDIVKTDGQHIFTIESSTFGFTVHVIEPNGSESKEIGRVIIPHCDCEEIYLVGDKLFAIGNEWSDRIESSMKEDVYRNPWLYDREKTRTVTTVVDISDTTAPQIIKAHTQTGRFNTSRISDGYLYVFTEDWYEKEEDYDKDRPAEFVPQIDGETFAADRIVRCGEYQTNNYMVMTSLSIDEPDRITDRLAVLGGGATYYVSTENIYIARPEGNRWYTPIGSLVTSITKFRYNDGMIKKVAATTFRGMIENSYYMHEYQGNFCFVYTSAWNSGQSTNGLCVLDGDMNPLGEIDKIAAGEQIYASYFIDNMAYFVTYRNTDPVFAVDISNPSMPELKSELKLPGFSSYLHSFGDDKLIGIGYGDPSKDGSGWDGTTKLSLFEIGKDYSIKELSKLFAREGERNTADQNHRAVFVDEKRGLVGLSLSGAAYDEYLDDATFESIYRGHYVVYQMKGNKFKKVMDTANDKNVEITRADMARGVRIGETFYVCDPEGVKTAYTIGTDGKTWVKA